MSPRNKRAVLQSPPAATRCCGRAGNSGATAMIQDSQQKVVVATWLWRDREKRRADEKTRHRRRRVLIQSSIALAVAALMLLCGYRATGTIAAFVSAMVFAIGCGAPRLFDGIDRAIAATAQAFGRCLNWVRLAPFFYLVFLPARLILLARGKAPMTRRSP